MSLTKGIQLIMISRQGFVELCESKRNVVHSADRMPNETHALRGITAKNIWLK